MKIFDIFSKRRKREQGDIPDVFVYDHIPKALRVQIVHIWNDALGDLAAYNTPAATAYKTIHDALCREYGQFSLNNTGHHEAVALTKFVLSEQNTERVLDAVELSFRYIEAVTDDHAYRSRANPTMTSEDAIAELNARFLEHGVGYEYINRGIIRKDSEFLHSEVVKPALGLLRGSAFAGPNDEFLRAHEHYRHGRHKECLNECLKALESTLKVICKLRGWSHKPTDTARMLLSICFGKGLIPEYLQSEFTALRATLESGIPTVRNKESGHGQGAAPTQVPDHLAGYLLHLTATSILFLTHSAELKK